MSHPEKQTPSFSSLAALIRQVFIFGGVGVFNTLSCLLIIFILSSLLHVHYIVANICGYGLTMAMGFYLHKTLTFRSKNHKHALPRQISAFLATSAIAYILQLGSLILLIEIMHIPHMIAQVVSMGLYIAISFIGNKFFTFQQKHRDDIA